MMSPPEPFYECESMQLFVYNSKTLLLRLGDFVGERDTGFINLPWPFHTDRRRGKFRFYTVLNYSADDGNEFGLWIYVYHPSFNYKIQGCTFRVIKGLNTYPLAPTTSSDSVVGMYQSPCYEIVNNSSVLDFLIQLPNMTFQTSNLDDDTSEENVVGTDGPVKPKIMKIMKEVNLSTELMTAYKQMMNQSDYDVYFEVGGKKIGSYKFALCAVSDVFKAAFKEHTKESQSGEIAIYDFDHNIVQMFVDALHTHKIYFTDDPVMTLQLGMLANKYNVACIEKAAQDSFNAICVDRHNFVDVYRLAAYDDVIMGKLMQRFVEMRIDTKDIEGFEELSDKMKIELYQSAHRTSIGQ